MKAKLFTCLLSLFLYAGWASANNMLIQNVTTTGNNAAAKTIQVQFDISWDNSWRDGINWDAAWVFIKFKDANGLWQHAQLNQTGFANGSGTANTVKVTSDKVGCWVYRSALGSGTFNATGMQLQWNYGLSGLNDVTGLEVRVFSTEMVYVPEGEFNCAKGFYIVNCGYNNFYNYSGKLFAPGNNFPVIGKKITPVLNYADTSKIQLRIKGDAGLDVNSDGIIDNNKYPVGFKSFYCFKYELTENQYVDFLNTLTEVQKNNIGIAGSGITFSQNQYYSSTPNRACINSNSKRLLSFSDWAGLRPISVLEFNKASYGPLQPVYNIVRISSIYSSLSYPAWGGSGVPKGGSTFQNKFMYNYITNAPCGNGRLLTPFIKDVGYYGQGISNRDSTGASYYGVLDLTGNTFEPVVKLSYFDFDQKNGNGVIQENGDHDVLTWNNEMLIFVEQIQMVYESKYFGFRYCRSAE